MTEKVTSLSSGPGTLTSKRVPKSNRKDKTNYDITSLIFIQLNKI